MIAGLGIDMIEVERVAEKIGKESGFRELVFSKKEIEVITLICKEYFNKDISIALNMSVRTVEGYRERILQKTNARNTAGIVIYAVKNHIYKF